MGVRCGGGGGGGGGNCAEALSHTAQWIEVG